MPFELRRLDAAAIYMLNAGCGAFIRSLIYTVLAVYYVTTANMDPLQLVLAGTVMEATIVVFEVPTGVLADVFSRKLSIIAGRVLFGIAYLVQGALPVFATILVAEVVRGIGETFLSGATQAWLADEVGEDQLGGLFLRAAQVRRVCSLVGIAASVGLASLQLNLPILVGGGLSIALGAFLLAAMPERGFHPIKREGQRPGWAMLNKAAEGARQFRERPVLLVFLGIATGLGASSEGFDRLWEAHFLASFVLPSLGSLQPIIWFGIFEAGALLIGIVAVRALRRLDMNDERVIIRALLAMQGLWLIAAVVFGLAPSFAVAVLSFWSARVLTSIGAPLFETWQTRAIPGPLRATVLSAISQGDALGQVFGGPVVGAVGTLLSLRAAIVAAGIVRVPVLALLTLARRTLA